MRTRKTVVRGSLKGKNEIFKQDGMGVGYSNRTKLQTLQYQTSLTKQQVPVLSIFTSNETSVKISKMWCMKSSLPGRRLVAPGCWLPEVLAVAAPPTWVLCNTRCTRHTNTSFKQIFTRDRRWW